MRQRWRDGRRGQAMIEFALVAPFVFLLLFGSVEGGIGMYTMNNVDNGVLVGLRALAAEGNATAADTFALAAMRTAGVTNTPVLTISEVDIGRLDRQADGSLAADTTGCSGAPCLQKYTIGGTLISGNWASSARVVSSSAADFVFINVKYSISMFLPSKPSFSFTDQKYFRLEAQYIG